MNTPRKAVRSFDPVRAALPRISSAAAVCRLRAAGRPWLACAESEPVEVRWALAVIDMGNGHVLARNGPWLTRRMTRERAGELRDPAIPDSDRRLPGVDAESPGPHRCGVVASRFTDAYAFACCFARGIEHPDVRRALDQEFDPERTPWPSRVPLRDLLGRDGCAYVDGDRLVPVAGTIERALRDRTCWVRDTLAGRTPAVARPRTAPIADFDGWDVAFTFRPNAAKLRYEVETMAVVQPDV